MGRAGRAGRATKGLVIACNSADFSNLNLLIQDKDGHEAKGQLYAITRLIHRFIQRRQLTITAEILDYQNEEFQQLLDSIDTALLDLLAEEISSDDLEANVRKLVESTFSYFQADPSERETLLQLFKLRSEKLRPVIVAGDFPRLKKSGASIRLYNDIVNTIDLNADIWNHTILPTGANWLDYVLNDGIFRLLKFELDLAAFNLTNRVDLSANDIRKSIEMWLSGNWYKEIAAELEIDMHVCLRLINGFVSYNVESIAASIVRIREVQNPTHSLDPIFLNWPAMLQHGIDSPLKLDLVQMGLNDRLAVLGLSDVLNSVDYKYVDYATLRDNLSAVREPLSRRVQPRVPAISSQKLALFLSRL